MDYTIQYSDESLNLLNSLSTSFIIGYIIGTLIVMVFLFIVYWKLFEKAGEPGWGILIPIYNTYLLFKIAFGNGWLFLLMLVPFVNIIVAIVWSFKFASAFGKGTGYGFGILFLPVIFLPILAFGDAEYVGKQISN